MVEWQVFRDGTEETEVFDVAPVVDTINPFGDYAVVKIDDSQGEKFEQYQRGTELELEVTPEPGDDPISRFVGYVVERRELDQDGADVLEVEAYTFDQFLRRNTVTNDQTGNTISEALEDIVTTDTPITYESTNVEVGDPQELTRSYRGEPVESALRDLAFKSTNENFGVNDDREFFFRPRETVHIDRGIDNTNWLNYDIPELGKEEINEVEVWFDDGDESVIVDNGKSKLDLQDSLGLSSPGTQRKEINRPRLTDISDAEDAGRQYLKFRNTTLSGEITTFGLFEATPGDTIDVTIPQRGIDTEFQIVSIEYEWGRDETLVEVVEKRGFTDDILVRLGEAVQRQEMEGADRDAPKNRITTTDARAIIDVDVDADGNTPDGTRLVNDGRRAVRDGWAGNGNPEINTLVVGDSAEGLSRSNSTLKSKTRSVVVDGSTQDGNVAEYSATISETNVQEIGLLSGAETDSGTLGTSTATKLVYTSNDPVTADVEIEASGLIEDGEYIEVRAVENGNVVASEREDATGDETLSVVLSESDLTFENLVVDKGPSNTEIDWSYTLIEDGNDVDLMCRAVFDTAVDLDGSVTVTFTVSNDDSVDRGVLTDDGQEAVRDVLADNSPTLPTDYGYGSDDTAVAETDTDLGNELVSVSIDDVLIQSADVDSEWSSITSLTETDPLIVNDGQLNLGKSGYLVEAEDADSFSGDTFSDSALSGGTGVEFGGLGDSISHTFTTQYPIPAGAWSVFSRDFHDGVPNEDTFPRVTVTVDGNEVVFESTFNSSLDWSEYDANNDFELSAGTHTIEIEYESGDVFYKTDLIGLFDTRFDYDFDNTDLSTVSRSHLNGPELFPNSITTEFDTATFRINITAGRFESVWNDTSNEQYIQINNERFNNTANSTFLFSSITDTLDSEIRLSRFPVDTDSQNETPRFGYNGQSVDLWELFVNPDTPRADDIGETVTRAIVPPDTSGIVGETVRECGLKNGSTLLTRHLLADFTLLEGQRLASSESTTFTGNN